MPAGRLPSLSQDYGDRAAIESVVARSHADYCLDSWFGNLVLRSKACVRLSSWRFYFGLGVLLRSGVCAADCRLRLLGLLQRMFFGGRSKGPGTHYSASSAAIDRIRCSNLHRDEYLNSGRHTVARMRGNIQF